MRNAPTVYVPTEPEGNGLTLPTLLSLLAHGLVIGILAYTYQNMEVETAGSIETVMISPEQLAEMQGEILANRAAAASAMPADSGASGSATNMPETSFDDSVSYDNPSEPISQRVPVFTRSDEAVNPRPMLMSEEQHQRLLEQNQEYERNMAEFAAQLDESVTEEHGQVEQNKNEQLIEEQNQLGDSRHKQNNPPKITRPTATDKNLKINTGDSGSAGQRYDLEADGNSTTSNGGSSSTSRSTGEFKSAILSKIQSKLDTPIETQGLTTSLSLKLDTRGNVKSAKASGPNAVVNQAVEQAARAASPLPIDLDNPESFANLTINVTIN